MPLQRNSDSEERTCGQDEGCAAHGRHRQRRQECRRREDGRRGRRTEGTCCQKQTRARGGNLCAHNWSTRHLQVLLAADGGEVYALSNKCAHMGIRYVMGRRRPGVVRTLPAHSLAHSLARSLTRSFNLTAWWARRNCFRCVDLTRPADTPSTCARSRRLPSLPLTRATRFVRPPGRSFRRMHHLSRARYQVCPEKWRGPGALVSEPPGAAVCGQDWEPALQPADLCGLRRRVWRRLGGPLGWNSSDCLDY